MKKLLIILFAIACANVSHAQGAGKILTKAPKKPVTRVKIPSYGGNYRAIMGVDYYISTASAATVATGVSAATSTVNNSVSRSWFTQQQRNLKAWKLKKERARLQQASLETAQLRAAIEAAKAAAPKLQPQRAFETPVLENLVSPIMPAGGLPVVAEPGVLYRGLALSADGAAISNILQNGLRIADAGTEANTRNLALSGGIPGAVRAARAHTNLTSFPDDAIYWANKRASEEKNLIVVVQVTGYTEEMKSIVPFYEDIPAQDISQVIAPLNIDGEPTWCQLSLHPNGIFTVTPYETQATAENP